MPQITPGYDDERRYHVGDCGENMTKLHEQYQKCGSGKHTCTVDGVAFEIFFQKIAFAFENKIFIAQKRIGYSQNIAWYCQHQIVYAAYIMTRQRVNAPAEKGVPRSGQ